MISVERCFICDEPTERAGQLDDSLYDENGKGPYCSGCWDSFNIDISDAVKISEYIKKLQELLRRAKQTHYVSDDNATWSCVSSDDYREFIKYLREEHGAAEVLKEYKEPGSVCTCGAAEWNAEIEAALAIKIEGIKE